MTTRKQPKANSRAKGASYEREVAHELFLLTGVSFARDLEQYRAADHGDLITDTAAWPFVVECKRYAAGSACKPAWKAQATAAARASGKLPIVVYRFDRQETKVAVPWAAISAAYGSTVHPGEWPGFWTETDLDGLAFLAREIMAQPRIEAGPGA